MCSLFEWFCAATGTEPCWSTTSTSATGTETNRWWPTLALLILFFACNNWGLISSLVFVFEHKVHFNYFKNFTNIRKNGTIFLAKPNGVYKSIWSENFLTGGETNLILCEKKPHFLLKCSVFALASRPISDEWWVLSAGFCWCFWFD